jgi:hypothetical protein
VDDRRAADVTRVQDELDAVERCEDFGAKQTVRVGDQTYEHALA